MCFFCQRKEGNKSLSWYIYVMFINVFSESNLLCCTHSVLKVIVMRRPWTTANVYKSKVNISLLYLYTINILLRYHFSKKSLENPQNMPRYYCRTGQKYWVTKWLQWTILEFSFFRAWLLKKQTFKSDRFFLWSQRTLKWRISHVTRGY